MAIAALGMAAPSAAQNGSRPELLIRIDDIGMNHSVNLALQQLAETGIPLSASVMFTCPWYQEAVDILRKHPQISVGVHLVLNSEWKWYRWGPVLGAATPELLAVVERIADKHGLGISHYFGEIYRSMFDVPIAEKRSAFRAYVDSLTPQHANLVVIHVAQSTPEIRALVDMNNATQNTATGEPLMALHRQAELDMLLQFARGPRRVTLVNYSGVIARLGRASMRRPALQ